MEMQWQTLLTNWVKMKLWKSPISCFLSSVLRQRIMIIIRVQCNIIVTTYRSDLMSSTSCFMEGDFSNNGSLTCM
jgi:hypothetical protein